MSDNNSGSNNSTNPPPTPTATTSNEALPRVTRAAGPGMSAPSSRMTAPSKRTSKMRRSESFKRTAKGSAAPLDRGSDHSRSSAAAGAATTSSTDLLLETATTARPPLNSGSSVSSFSRGTTSSTAFVKNFLEDGDGTNTPTSSAGLQFDADTQRNVHASLLSPSPDSPTQPPKQQTTASSLLTTGRSLLSGIGGGGGGGPGPSTTTASSQQGAQSQASNQSQGQQFVKPRDDFYNVDQSVNLMDADAGQYESSKREARSSGRRSTGQAATSMVEIFLKEHGGSGSTTSSGGMNTTRKSHAGSGWWYHPQRQAAYGNMSTWEKIKDVAARLIVPLACFAVFAVVIFVIVLVHYEVGVGNEPTSAPASTIPADVQVDVDGMTPPMKVMSSILIGLDVASLSAFQDARSPTFQALTWISKDNIAQMAAEPNDQRRQRQRQLRRGLAEEDTGMDSHRLVQRYVLAVLFYAWQPHASTSGGDADGAPASAMASLNLKPNSKEEASGAVSLHDKELWLSAVSECHWKGVDCHDEAQELTSFGEVSGLSSSHSFVRSLNLTNHELTGTLPMKELTALSNLVVLDLRNNKLSGSLEDNKDYLAHWKNLQYILLGENQITGTLPSSMTELKSIQDIDVSSNKLSGPLPNWEQPMQELENLYLENNTIAGEISSTFLRALPNVEYVDLSHNKLTGKLKKELAELKGLRYWHADHNGLSGNLPKEMSAMSRLETLSLQYNKLEGKLGDDIFGGMERLVNMHLSHNELTGKLPESLSFSNRLKIAQVGHNSLTGTLPSSWFSPSKALYWLEVTNNQLSGSLPTTLGSVSATLEKLSLSHNAFTGQLPSELGQLSELLTCFLPGNKFSGSIPESFSGMEQLENLRLFDNPFLTGAMPSGLCDTEQALHNDPDPDNKLLISADCKTGGIQCDCCHKCY